MLKPGLWAIVPAVLFATAPLRGQPAPLAPDFQISTSGIDVYSNASVVMNDFGEFVVVWNGGDDGSSRGIFARRYDAAGQPLGEEFTGVRSFPSALRFSVLVRFYADGAEGDATTTITGPTALNTLSVTPGTLVFTWLTKSFNS